MQTDWKAKLRAFAQVAARQEKTAPALRVAVAASVVGRVPRPPGADWRLLTATERHRRNEERAFERRVREQCRAAEHERKRRAEEAARKEERRILAEIAAAERQAARRAREHANEKCAAALTANFIAKLTRAAEEMRAAPPPERTEAQRREDRRWLKAYCEAFRFEPRPNDLPHHFACIGPAVPPTPPSGTTAPGAAVLHIEHLYEPDTTLCGAIAAPVQLVEVGEGATCPACVAVAGRCLTVTSRFVHSASPRRARVVPLGRAMPASERPARTL